MSQTLLALLALMVATLFAVNHQRRMIIANEGLVRSEFQLMANAVASLQLEVIAGEDYGNLLTHDSTNQTINFTAGDVDIAFDVDVYAGYSDASGNPGSATSGFTQIEVEVSHARYPYPLVMLERVFAE